MAFWRGLKQKLSSWQSLNATRSKFTTSRHLCLCPSFTFVFLCNFIFILFYVLCLCIYRFSLCFSFFCLYVLLCCLRAPRVVVIIGPQNLKNTKNQIIR